MIFQISTTPDNFFGIYDKLNSFSKFIPPLKICENNKLLHENLTEKERKTNDGLILQIFISPKIKFFFFFQSVTLRNVPALRL